MAFISEEQMAVYRASAQQRQRQERDRMARRHQLGLAVACQASKLLKQEFGATKVVLFGSMRTAEKVHSRSDVDLAVWG
ncbi:MAG: nucleotidyltransferase domain-containing protein, partial [Leptolyngbyaceae cyanobacterium SM2_3_12]|nr:nucleotidyltransferase domain-containing protein [Leptolyngbyaceae cyanobacterium SM2_3_12]